MDLIFEGADFGFNADQNWDALTLFKSSITVNNAPTHLSSGIELNTDGGNDSYLIADDGGAILGGATALTFETTFAGVPSAGISTPLISYAAGDSLGNDFSVNIEPDGDLAIIIDGSTRLTTGFNFNQLLDGEIHSLAITWDSGSASYAVYVDGELVTSGFIARDQVIAGSAGIGELVFGNHQDSIGGGFSTGQAFQGTFYDVRIWDRFLETPEIRQYQNQKLDPADLPSGLIANWQFDGFEAGDVVDVVSGNNLSVGHAAGTGFIASTPIVDLNIDKDTTNGTQVGYVIPTDTGSDAAESFTFAILDSVDGPFAIDPDTGEITVVDASQLDFETSESFDINIEVTDASGNSYSEVVTIIVNDLSVTPPTIDLDADDSAGTSGIDFNTTFESGGSAISLTDGAVVGDVDGTIQTLIIRISNIQDGSAERLAFFRPDGLNTSYVASNGFLRFTAGASTTNADFQQVLNSITYQNTSPTPDLTTREITFVVNDGELDSSVATTFVSFGGDSGAPVNDAPTTSPVALTPIAEDSGTITITQADLLANSADADGDALTATGLIKVSGNGTLVDNGDGTWNYTPAASDDSDVSFSYTVTDGMDNVAGDATLDITPVNDAPVLAVGTNPQFDSITEDDINNAGETVGSLLLKLGDPITDVDGDPEGIAVTDNNGNGGTWQYSTDEGATWFDVGPVSTANALLLRDTDLLRLNPDGRQGTAANLGFRAWDRTIGDEGTFVDVTPTGTDSPFSSQALSAQITVTDVNDAPVLDNAGQNTLSAIDENNFTSAGDTVANIIASAGNPDAITDVDADAVEGIAIYAVDSPEGTFEYSTDGTNFTSFGVPSTSSALLLSADALIRFVPNPDFTGNASFTYRAWDQTEGSEGGTIDLNGNFGETGSLSIKFDTAIITVNNVDSPHQIDLNGAAVGQNNTVSYTENDSPIFVAPNAIVEDFGENDIASLTISGDGFGGADTEFRIEGRSFVPGEDISHTFDVNGQSITASNVGAGDDIIVTSSKGPDTPILTSNVQAIIQGLSFRSESDGINTDDQIEIQFTATDLAGRISPLVTSTISLIGVNDSPELDDTVAADFSSINEDDFNSAGTKIADILDRSTSDEDGDPVGIAIFNADQTNGKFEYALEGATEYVAFGDVSDSSALLLDASTRIRFVPAPDYNGDATISFKAWDQTIGAEGDKIEVAGNSGGTNSLSTGDDTATITVDAVNDAPTIDLDADDSASTSGVDYNTSFATGGGAVLLTDGAVLDDVDGTIQSLTISITNIKDGALERLSHTRNDNIGSIYTAETGSLTLIGGDSATNADFEQVLNSLTYENTSLTPDTTQREITFVANDGEIDSSIATAFVSLSGDAIAPVLVINSGGVVDEGQTLTITSNELQFFDVQGTASINYSVTSTPANGFLALSSAATTPISNFTQEDIDLGNLIYVHSGSETTSDLFVFTVDDGLGNSDSGQFDLFIQPVNDAPTALGESISINEDTTFVSDSTNNLLFNDSDADGDPLTVNATPIVGPSKGTLVLNEDGSYTYTPNADFNGTDSFTYEITDGTATATAAVNINIAPVNDTPTASGPASLSTGEQRTLRLNGTGFTLGDIDSGDSDIQVVFSVTEGIVFTSFGDSGVSVSNDDATTTITGTVTEITNLLSGSSTGFVAYQNNLDSPSPTATITMLVNDLGNTGADPGLTGDEFSEVATTTTTINITPVNDAPNLTLSGISVDEGSANNTLTNENLIGTDVDDAPADLTYRLLSTPSEGLLGFNNGGIPVVLGLFDTFTQADVDSGRVFYNHSGSPALTDSFDLEFYDGGEDGAVTRSGTFEIAINQVNEAPTAVDDNFTVAEDGTLAPTLGVNDLLQNDSDPDGDTLTVNTTPVSGPANGSLLLGTDGTFTYTPNADFNGADSFTYQVSDANGRTAEATVEITVDPTNDDPVAVDDLGYTTPEDTSLTILESDLLANDSDVDGDALVITSASATNGTITFNTEGMLTYTPDTNFSGIESVRYLIRDGNGGTAEAIVEINVTPVNDAPTIPPVTLTPIVEDSGATIITQNDLLASANDVDGDVLTATGLTITAGSGTLVDNGDGTWSYTSAANDDSTVSFSYDVTDGNALVANTATLDITPVNDAPVAADDSFATSEDNSLRISTIDLLANDSDVDGDTLTVNFTPISGPANGTLSVNSVGSFRYTPDADFNGTDSFTYEITDGNGLTSTAVVNITVTPVNDTPTISPITLTSIAEDSGTITITQNVLVSSANDADGDVLTATGLTITSGSGTLVNNGDGTWSFTPDANDDSVVSLSASAITSPMAPSPSPTQRPWTSRRSTTTRLL